MWQSRVEIEHYSVAYFDRGTAFARATSVNMYGVLVVRSSLLAKWLREWVKG